MPCNKKRFAFDCNTDLVGTLDGSTRWRIQTVEDDPIIGLALLRFEDIGGQKVKPTGLKVTQEGNTTPCIDGQYLINSKYGYTVKQWGAAVLDIIPCYKSSIRTRGKATIVGTDRGRYGGQRQRQRYRQRQRMK